LRALRTIRPRHNQLCTLGFSVHLDKIWRMRGDSRAKPYKKPDKRKRDSLMIETKYDGLYIEGQRTSVYSGELHYWRLDPSKWEEILDKVKGMGFDRVTMYIPWEIHEVNKGNFDFGDIEPSKDLDKFLTLCEQKQLKVLVRPGPQINSELTWFGYPRRILENPRIQAKSAQNTKAVLTQVPRPIPALSYASEEFFEETAVWYDVVCRILGKHKAPRGCIIAVQVDNELGYFFHINSYMCDYSEASIKKYREFLKQKYESAEKLNALYHSNYESFEAIEPPRRFDGTRKEDLLYYVDWIEYRERYLINSLGRLARMLKERGLEGVPVFHNYPHPLGPGGSRGVATIPFNLPELEKELDFVGFDIYSRKELYDHVKTIISYVVACSRYPFIPEFIAGVWPWYVKPGRLDDEEFVTKAALMHGIKGFSRYMIVERNKWMGSPITRDGAIREERYRFFKRLNAVLREYDFADYRKTAQIALICNRDYDRLEAASVLISFPGDFLEPVLGFSEYPDYTTVSESNFGFDDPIQLTKTEWFDAHYKALSQQGYTFSLVDSYLDINRLKEYKALVLASFEYMSTALQENLVQFSRDGGSVILGPKIPNLNEHFSQENVLEKNLVNVKKVPITMGGKTKGFRYEIGRGKIIHLPQLDKEDHAGLLDSLLQSEIDKLGKNDPRIDITAHRNMKDRDRSLVFVANPTSAAISAEIKLLSAPSSVKEIWEDKPVKVLGPKIVDELPAYSIKMYECRG
jgi:beta-galactosidase